MANATDQPTGVESNNIPTNIPNPTPVAVATVVSTAMTFFCTLSDVFAI